MKYLLLKGAMGFGDRLQTLKMCVKFALENNLKLYVDWKDSIWSHESETFYKYFKLNVPSFELSDIPEDATVYPAVWKGNLDKIQLIDPTAHLGYLAGVYPADVIVHSCASYRHVYNDSKFFANVFKVIDPRVIAKVKQRQQTYHLSTKVGVHLRGTDRANTINKSHRMRGIGIRMVTAGLLGGTQFIAVSDDTDFITMWKSKYKFPLLTEVGNLGGHEGVHNKPKDSIAVTKDDLNVDLLVDFFTLASCSQIITSSNDSRFAQEAQRLHPYVNQILG